MALTCKNLMGLKAFDNIRLVAGRSGLDKLITWPYVKQTDSLKGWLNGGEILFVVEESKDCSQDFFTKIVKEAKELDVSAIVFLCNGRNYVQELPDEVRRLGDKYAIPLFEMPSDIRMIDVTKEISNAIFLWNYKNKQAENFLIDLIHEDYLQGLHREKEGMFYGFDLSKSYFVMVISDKHIVQDFSESYTLTLSNRFSVITMKIQAECNKHGDQLVNTILCGTAVCYISVDDNDRRKNYIAHIDELLSNYNMTNSCEMAAGVSRMYKNLEDMPKAYEEGRQALRYCMKKINSHFISSYEDMGIMQFLISGKDKSMLVEYSKELLSDLIEIDHSENSEYVKTLWLYLKNNNNLVKTSQVLYIHRNTLVNRINKIQSIIGKDINDVEVKVEYVNAFSILEFYGLMESYVSPQL